MEKRRLGVAIIVPQESFHSIVIENDENSGPFDA